MTTMTTAQAAAVTAIKARWNAEGLLGEAEWAAVYGNTNRRRQAMARKIPALRAALAEALVAEGAAEAALGV